jgi:hypothetical protein
MPVLSPVHACPFASSCLSFRQFMPVLSPVLSFRQFFRTLIPFGDFFGTKPEDACPFVLFS